MNLQEFKSYCSKKKGVRETFPFDEVTLVMKVGTKMFALTNVEAEQFSINLKCEPLLAAALRAEYAAIKPGFHMNKTHWNTVSVDGSIPEKQLLFMIDLSYDLVFKGLTKAEKKKIIGE